MTNKATNPKDRVTKTDKKFGESKLSQTQIEDLLIRARVNMLINQPFFGSIATRLKFIDATKWCPTAGTDGKHFYYNRDFISALPEKGLIFLMGHEVLHCVFDHVNPTYLGNRIPVLLNIAQDFVINLELVKIGCGEKITLVDICYDKKYDGMMSEEVYDSLFDDAKKDGRIYELGTLDMHMDGNGEGDEDSEDGPNDGTNGPIRISKEERQQIDSDLLSAVVQAAKNAGSEKTPGSVRGLLKHILDPQIDWRTLLAMQIQSILRSNYTWQKPSRKGMDAGLYLPSMDRDQTIDVSIAIDTSGSITDQMLREFLSEVYSIMSQYSDFTLRLWSFDTSVHNPVTFTADTMYDLMTYEPGGGGGTDFMVNWAFMKEESIEPKKFIMFTDMVPNGSFGDPDYCDTLFISNNSRGVEAPFGLTVPYKSQDTFA